MKVMVIALVILGSALSARAAEVPFGSAKAQAGKETGLESEYLEAKADLIQKDSESLVCAADTVGRSDASHNLRMLLKLLRDDYTDLRIGALVVVPGEPFRLARLCVTVRR